MTIETIDKSATIAALNDACRQSFGAGRIVFTAGFTNLPSNTFRDVVRAVARFDDFNEDNDPHGEHDFGSVEVDGEKCFWKIDYYDKALEYGSDDPADPDQTARVLTIMLASEY